MDTNTKEFEQELSKLEPIIWYFAKSTRLPGMDLEDIQQEFRIIAMMSWRKYDPSNGAQFSTFAFKNIQNRRNELLRTSIAQRRGMDREVVSLEDYKSAEDCYIANVLSTPGASPEEEVMDRELAETVKKVIDQETPRVRGIYYDLLSGIPQEVIAKRHGTNQSNISYYKSRMRKSLREALVDYR